MKARIGDFIQKDGTAVQVIGIDGEEGYLTSDGGTIADCEITNEDVLLESEVE